MKVILRSASNGSRWLEFADPQGRGDSFTCWASLVRDEGETSVGLEMITPFREDMLGFFEEMALAADGWQGSKLWRSEFAEMDISATNDGSGIATLVVTMSPPAEEWHTEEVLDLRTDELPRVAEAMKALLRVDRAARFQPVDDS